MLKIEKIEKIERSLIYNFGHFYRTSFILFNLHGIKKRSYGF